MTQIYIQYENDGHEVRFLDLKFGDFFRWGGELYQRVDHPNYNAICLQNGKVGYFGLNPVVEDIQSIKITVTMPRKVYSS